jgi:nucleoside-diphosphate-sugar epimerase
LSTAKAQRVLGWSPRFSLDEGLRRTEAWLREANYLNN